ncbi:hypothetical protein DM860_017943 [Cuscuta australis]|uniref:Complex III subunit 9 n=1 Tax=Cuscuta australis TaxID=267555 RepID=A0A328D1K2_9ASTE|nr:hypothetical protein DM860_017943 [Cuscuta australis]
MEHPTAVRRSGGGLFEGLYRVVMRRTSVYVTFVIAGAFLGERVVDYGIKKLWEKNNVGVFIPINFVLIFVSLAPDLIIAQSIVDFLNN